MNKPTVAVFAYDFPHRKSHDFILELAKCGEFNVVVLAAPWKKLGVSELVAEPVNDQAVPYDPQTLCRDLGVRYFVVQHEDTAEIQKIRSNSDFELGVIAGARIIKESTLGVFRNGIFNIHPGKLPETSGLDAYYYTIQKNVPFGVTGHFIDRKIDAGLEAFFLELSVMKSDSLQTLIERNYQLQIVALRKFIQHYKNSNFDLKPVNRKFKNSPMTKEQKVQVEHNFPVWRNNQIERVSQRELFEACARSSQVLRLSEILEEFPQLINTKSPEGWSPLIVAAYNQNKEAVAYLLQHGADLRQTGSNGTSVIMYAKTGLLHNPTSDYELLSILIEAGSSLEHLDKFGRSIFDYVTQSEDKRMLKWLEKRRQH